MTDTVKNSPYTNFTDSSESVYMCSDVYESSAVLYSTTIKYLISSLDCLDVEKSQQAYFCSHSSNLHNVYYADFTHNSNFCAFVDSCE